MTPFYDLLRSPCMKRPPNYLFNYRVILKKNFRRIFGPRLKTEVTYRISLVRPCVLPCVRPLRHILKTVHGNVPKFSGMIRTKILRNVTRPDFPKKYGSPKKHGFRVKIRQKCRRSVFFALCGKTLH